MPVFELTPVFVKTIPEVLEEGLLYISEEFRCSSHLCACGCRGEVYLRFKHKEADNQEHGWEHIINEGKVTIRPSIGNWSGQSPYHAHYLITIGNWSGQSPYHAHYLITLNKIEWV